MRYSFDETPHSLKRKSLKNKTGGPKIPKIRHLMGALWIPFHWSWAAQNSFRNRSGTSRGSSIRWP